MHAFIADILYTQFHSTNPYLFYSMHLMGFIYTEAVFQRELRESLQIFTKKTERGGVVDELSSVPILFE